VDLVAGKAGIIYSSPFFCVKLKKKIDETEFRKTEYSSKNSIKFNTVLTIKVVRIQLKKSSSI
jgi:hypothetical protein